MVVYVLVEEWSSNPPSSGNHSDYDISTTTTPTSTTVTATSASLLPSATTAITTHHRSNNRFLIVDMDLHHRHTIESLSISNSWYASLFLCFQNLKPVAYFIFRKLLASGGAWQCNRSCGNIDMTLERYDLEFGSDELQAMCVLQAHRIFKLDTSWASYSEYMKFFTNEHCLNAANE
ncbi:hypothetical protein L2E82_35622 [Cichorium intybus]|uniref:Uncharacterized protein n=1 Tax=Cichorium intybus TaxID=13427 RepID=A0ACB9BPA1_CICIN|nr:hypothetical protein L2E82_35622 [Cichorium intybus]